MDAFIFWTIVIGAIAIAVYCDWEQKQKATEEANRRLAQEEELRRTNPEAYIALKQMEHEQQMMLHHKELSEKKQKHEMNKAGADFGTIIAKWFFGK